MNKKQKWFYGLFLFLAGLALVAMAQTKLPEATNPAPAAPSWTMKMRIFEVPGKGAGEPVKAVTSSYLKYSLTATIKTEYDLAEEMKQIQKTFNYQDVKLLTEADFSWKRNERDKQFHIFRLDGLEYLILITPVDVLRKLTFRIEVLEQGEKAKTNLLDTEFSIPEKNIAVFGFEDTKGNVYFLSFRVTGWVPAPSGAVGGIMGGVVGGVLTTEEARKIAAEGEALGPVRALGEIKPPRLIKQVDPVYPAIARQARVDGVVILEVETDTYGRVRNTRILRSIPLLDKAAIDAVRQWVYEPAIIDGKPRGVFFTTTVRFQLVDASSMPARRKDGEPLKLTGDVKGPKLIKQVDPVYPPVARQSQVEGTVILEVTTDIYGRVRDIKVLRSIPLLDQAAVDAVKQWVYEPPIINGKPISVTFTVTVTFTLK
jgi:TonB family protein